MHGRERPTIKDGYPQLGGQKPKCRFFYLLSFMAGKVRLGKNVKSIKQNSGVFPVALIVLVLPVIDVFLVEEKEVE